MPGFTLYDEKTLLAEIAAGNEQAFKKLFDYYKERFYAVALKMTGSDEVAEDIVQDVFMNIWKNREGLADINNPPSYFFTIIYRRIYQYYRKVALEKKLLQVSSSVRESVDTTEEMVMARDCTRLISQAISKLPPQQQLVFNLTKHEGLSRDDVARQLHLSPNTVKNHLGNALKFIRTFLHNSNSTFLIILLLFKKYFFGG